MVIHKDPIYDWRPIETWLAEVTSPIGIVEAVEKIPRGRPDTLMDGSLIIVRAEGGEDRVEDIAEFLARLANHADTAVSLTARQVLRWCRLGAWHYPTEQSIWGLIERTDVFLVDRISKFTKTELEHLGSNLESRGVQRGKITTLVGPQADKVPILPDVYGSRTVRVE